ncbi:MAG: hypothetical protein ABI557_14995 [Aureliella sp.]
MTQKQTLATIDVTSLGSYVFCRRAGVIAYNKQGLEVDGEEEPRKPNLGYMPDFSIAELRARFDDVFPSFLRYGLGFLIGFVIVSVIARIGSTSLSLLILLAILPVAFMAITDGLKVLWVLNELRRYKTAAPFILDPTAKKPVEVSWYALVKSGYIPIKPGSRLNDPDLNLTGKPWRFLQTTDGVRIPVFNYAGQNFQVRESQVMRLALYSHLCIVEMGGSKSDWGILLDVQSKRCFAIPIDDHLRTKAAIELGHFSKKLEDDRNGIAARIPVAAPCQNCRFGKPRPYVEGKSETTFCDGAIGAHTENGHGGQLVHSDCGDKFEWHPRHRYWEQRKA